MPPRKRKRKLLWLLAIALAGFAILFFALPVWLPWALPPIARRLGVTYSHYERRGYQRFALSEVVYTNRSITLSAARLEAVLPSLWLWRLAELKSPPREPFALATDVVLQSGLAKGTGQTSSVSDESRTVNQTLEDLAFWIPMAAVSNGTLCLGQPTLTVPDLLWSNGTISANVQLPHVPALIAVRARRSGPDGYVLEARSAPLHLTSTVFASTNATGLALLSISYWWSNRIDLQAQFGPTGTLPLTATITSDNFQLPAEALAIPQYRELRGSSSAKWEAGTFWIDLQARTESPPDETNLPPITVNLHARGDTNAVTIETASLTSPALKAELSRRLAIHFKGQLLREPAHLVLDSDLSRQSWVKLRGHLKGEADLVPGSGRYPEARFRFTGAELGYDFVQTKSFEVEGRFEWPQLEVFKALARLEDGSVGTASGSVDLERRSVAGGELSVSGPTFQRWLPAGYAYEALNLTGKFSGPFEQLSHAGELGITNAIIPFLQPVNIHAFWSGMGSSLAKMQVALSNQADALSLDGSLEVWPDRTDLRLEHLSFETNGRPCLALSQPAQLVASRAEGARPWQLETSPLEIAGAGGRLRLQGAVEWPRSGKVTFELDQFSSRLVARLLQAELPEVEISKLEVAAAWTNGPLQFDITAAGSAVLPEQLRTASPLTLELAMAGNQNGLTISNLVLASQTSMVARVEGMLPLTLSPSLGSEALQFSANQQLRLVARAEPQSVLWNELLRHTGLSLRDPHFEVDVSGTWEAPQGILKAGAARVAPVKPASRFTPNLEGFQVDLKFSRQEARLTRGRLLVQGQPLKFEGLLPLGDRCWVDLLHGKPPDLGAADGRLQLENADLAAFEPLFSEVLAPQGRLSLDLFLRPGLGVDGQLSVSDARTRPLGPVGSIRGVFIKANIKERVLTLEQATGSIGAATVNLAGQADLRGAEWLGGALPPFNVTLHGLSVPLARQPEFVIRSDLALAIAKTNGNPPLITGNAKLHDSYYLSDLRALVPGKVASPERRPPYFSVREPLLEDSRLAVDVSGTRFLKLRSPLFDGLITANLKLQGTLKDPILLGDVAVDSGAVRFPFARLPVQQGLVSLTSQDPFHPHIMLNAGSRQFGYDVRMTVSGSVDEPMIQFSSTPPLSSEQILLMVSAGEMPQGTSNLTSQQRAQTVALFLGKDLLAKLGVGDETQPRLTIRSGEQFSEQGRPTYGVEYKLGDRWSITGEYDQFGDFNAGFKWRVYSK